MSFAKVLSFMSTMTPTDLGFFGYMWEIIGNFFVWLFTFVVNAFYGVCKWFLAVVDFLQYFIQKLIGLDYWLSAGSKDLKGATENDLLFSFLYNETVQDVFRALVGLFIVFLIIFTIFAIIRQEWKFVTGTEKDNTKSKILSGSLKAIALVIITPLILVIGIISSNAILASIVKALNINMATTFGNTIFSIASVNGNKYRIYTDSGNRTPVSSDVTFYIDSSERLILLGNKTDDTLHNYCSTYKEYLNTIAGVGVKKYTVDSMFKKVVPSKYDEDDGFYGYCISLNMNGTNTYYLVDIDVDNKTSSESLYKIEAMYYYLRNVLQANIMEKNSSIGNSNLHVALKDKIASNVSSTPCLISDFDIDGSKSDAVYEACYNTWEYASIYKSTTSFETTNASIGEYNLNEYGITGSASAKVMYNAYDYQKYFDGGHLGVVQMNAEYGVMTDVIDFICETGANLYILDATSSLIKWNDENYQVDGKWVSEFDGGKPRMYTNGGTYLPFVVDYSESALDQEQGKTLYLAKQGESNELYGSKFIMCWKVSTADGVRYLPLVNGKTYRDPITQQTYTFNSTYLANGYKGVVLAKGNFDQDVSSANPSNGDPTYFRVGASLGEGKYAIEYENEPYYYDISENGALKISISASSHSDESVTLKNISFDNSSHPNYAMAFDESDKSLFRFIDSNTGDNVDINSGLIEKLTIRIVDGSNKNDAAIYTGVNDGTNYLFVSESSARAMALCKEDSTTLSVRGINGLGDIGDDGIVPIEIQSGGNTITVYPFTYTIKLDYRNGTNEETIPTNPLNLSLTSVSDGKSLFSTVDKYYVQMGNIKQNMTLCAYFNESSLYNLDGGKLKMATFEGAGDYTLQMFKVSLYDFMVGCVDGDVYKYVNDASEIKSVTSSDVIETYDFGVVIDTFEWLEDSTDYSVFNGSAYVAKFTKAKGLVFGFDNIAGTNGEDSLTTSIEIDGIRYYNVKTQNVYADTDAMESAYGVINDSMFVGCYRDRGGSDFWTCDFHFSLVGNMRFKLQLSLPEMEKACLLDESYGVFNLTEGIAFDYFFEGDNSLLQFYNPYKIAYWIILIASALIIKTLGTALWGVIKRFYEVTLYYLAMPVAASTIPLDGGSKFGKVQNGLISNVLGAYGVILGINVFFILLSPVKSLSNIFTQAEMDSSTSYFLKHFPFGAKVLNNYVYILFVLVAFTMIDALPKVINDMVGGKDVVAEGKATKDNAAKAVSSAGDMISGKAAMDFGKKTIDNLSKTPGGAVVRWGVGKAKNAVSGVASLFNKGVGSQEGDDSAQGGGSQQSSRADGSEEAQTQTQGGVNEGDETTEMQNASTNSRMGENGEGDDETNAADASNEAEKENEIANEFNKQHAEEVLGEDGAAETIKEMAQNGENQEVTNAIASNIANDAAGKSTEENKDIISKETASLFGLDEAAVREIVRQMLGEQGQNMSDDELDNYSIALNKDLMGNITGSTLKKKGQDGSVEEVKDIDADTTTQAIVANASNDKIKEAYNGLDEEQKAEADTAVAESGSSISFTQTKQKEASDEQKAETVKEMAKSAENTEVANAVAGEVVGQKMDEIAEQNKAAPETETAELERDYVTELGLDDKLESGKTISAEEVGVSESEARRLKEDILGTKEVELDNKQQTTISKNLNDLGVKEGQSVSEKHSGLAEDELIELKKKTLGSKADNMLPEEFDKYKLIFAKDENGNISASLSIPTDEISNEDLDKYKLEFAKDENGKVTASVTAPKEETSKAATIDASMLLSEEQIRQIVAEILGEKADGMTPEKLSEYKLKFNRNDDGKVTAFIEEPLREPENEFDFVYNRRELTDEQMAVASSKIAENATDEQIKSAYDNMDTEVKAKVDEEASKDLGTETVKLSAEDATLESASVDALKLIDKHKNDEDVENAVILRMIESDENKNNRFLQDAGLTEKSSKEEKLAAIASMKKSEEKGEGKNEASMAYAKLKDGEVTDYHAKVVAEMVAEKKLTDDAWDLASDAEKEEFRQQQKEKNHEYTEEEQKVATEMNMQAVRDYEGQNKEDYDERIIKTYINDDSIEGKSAITTNLLLKASGLDDKKSTSYAEAAKVIESAKFSYGNKKINLQEIAKKGYSEYDVLVAYKKMQVLQDKNGKIGSDSVYNKKDKSLNADLLMKMLENPDANTDEVLAKITAKDVNARKTVSDMLMKGTNGQTPLLTSEQQDGLVSKIAEGDGDGFTFIAKRLGQANNGKDERGTAYNMVIEETMRRKQVDDIYESQGKIIDAEQLNKMSSSENYQALLDQINEMRAKSGEAKVSEISSADLQKLINNENNLGYDPTELVNLRKEIIRNQIDSAGSDKVFTQITDSAKLSGRDKDNFEYKKAIVADQVRSEGDNSQTLANLFKNSNFVGKDELQKEIMDIVNKLKGDDKNKGKSDEELFAIAVNSRLEVKNEPQIKAEIESYQKANGVEKEEAEQVVRQKYEQAENIRNVLYSVGATDITKAISKENLEEKQSATVKSDLVLSKQVESALAADGITKDSKEYETKYAQKIQELASSDIAFKGRLDEKVQSMIDPSKQVSDEDKKRFFASKAQEDLSTKKIGPISEGIKTKNKNRKRLPKESKKYDEWNQLIDKDLAAVKSGKGVYAGMSKEERKAKLEELQNKKIQNERPDEYYDWDISKQREYDDNQNILKNEALNVNISKVKKKDAKAFKPKDKKVILRFADATVDKMSNTKGLRKLSSRFASDDLKAKHNKELLLEEEKIARFNSTAPMRKREVDFGSNFENFAKSYISKDSIERIENDIKKKGLTGEAAIKAREEALAKQMNRNYKAASAKVARDNRVDENEFLVEKGVNAGNVRYKDGTKKYTQVKSRLGRRTAKIVEKYEKELESGNVSDKTRKKYEKSKFANRTETAAIKSKNQQKLYDDVVEFNRSYKKGDGDYAALFKQKFGEQTYKKYANTLLGSLDKSPAIVQQKEILKRIESDLKKNLDRQKYSSYIPASDKSKNRFRADTFTNAKTKAAVDHDREMAAHYNNAIKQFKALTANGQQIDPDEFLKRINPAVLGKKLEDFKGVDNEFIKNYLEKGYEKYRKRVVNNTFSPSQKANLVKLNGTYVDKSKVQNSRISNTVLRSLRATDADVYKNIVKQVNSARAKVVNEEANLSSLKEALKSSQTGVQNNAARAEAEKIKKAISNSEIKLNNLKSVLSAEESRKRAFEQAIAADRIKKAVRENARTAPPAPNKPFDYRRPDGTVRPIAPNSLDFRQIRRLERMFMARARAELENMTKILISRESEYLVKQIKKTREDLSYDARKNLKELKALQLKIKKEIDANIAKKDKKSKQYIDELKLQNSKIDETIKNMSSEFAKMDININKN